MSSLISFSSFAAFSSSSRSFSLKSFVLYLLIDCKLSDSGSKSNGIKVASEFSSYASVPFLAEESRELIECLPPAEVFAGEGLTQEGTGEAESLLEIVLRFVFKSPSISNASILQDETQAFIELSFIGSFEVITYSSIKLSVKK